jgi:hypothetical protein
MQGTGVRKRFCGAGGHPHVCLVGLPASGRFLERFVMGSDKLTYDLLPAPTLPPHYLAGILLFPNHQDDAARHNLREEIQRVLGIGPTQPVEVLAMQDVAWHGPRIIAWRGAEIS